MHNINPTLIHGQVLSWLDKSGADIRPHEKDYISTRIYLVGGSGCYFTDCHQAQRWYYKDSPDADHFGRADIADVEAEITAGGRVQVCGSRGVSYGVWRTWDDFAREVLT